MKAEKACAALEKGRAAKVAAVMTRPQEMAEEDLAKWRKGLFRCAGAGKGAWAVEAAKEKGEARWTLAYIGLDGKITRTAPMPLSEFNDVAVLGAFDFDGDGVAEAIASARSTRALWMAT